MSSLYSVTVNVKTELNGLADTLPQAIQPIGFKQIAVTQKDTLICFFIPKQEVVISDPKVVIPDLIRDPVPREHWIAGQARNDNDNPQ